MTTTELREHLLNSDWLSGGICYHCQGKEIFTNVSFKDTKLKIHWNNRIVSIEYKYRHVCNLTFETITEDTIKAKIENYA